MPPEPSRRLAPTARWLWRAQGLMATVAALVVAGVLQSQAPGGAVWVLLPLVVAGVGAFAVPELRSRRWRYEVTVGVHTAAGATTIPALEEAHAGRLRDRIATLARTADEL